MSKTEKNTNLVKRIENAVASERENQVFIMIPEDTALPLEQMGATVNGNELRLFPTPGSPETGWVINGLPVEPLQRIEKQSHVIVAEITTRNTFSRIIELRIF